MIPLPHGCKWSELKVYPGNWDSPRASMRKKWYIYYRFYDPRKTHKFPKGKLRIVKGMNEFDTLLEAVKMLIETEMVQLKRLGFNPITEKHAAPIPLETAIHPETPFVEALKKAYDKGNYIGRTKTDIKSVLRYIGQAATVMHIDFIPIKEFKTSHLLLLMEQCGRIKDIWTNNNYNTYLKYLSILFSHILQYRVIEYNPIRDVTKKKITKSARKILTPEECNTIDEFTRSFDVHLWQFILFFLLRQPNHRNSSCPG
jgi:hypothetical protein